MKVFSMIVLLAVSYVAVAAGMIEDRGILTSASAIATVSSAAQANATDLTTTIRSSSTTTTSVTRFTTVGTYTQSDSTSTIVSGLIATSSGPENAGTVLENTVPTLSSTVTDVETGKSIRPIMSVEQTPTESSTTTIFETSTISSVVGTVYVTAASSTPVSALSVSTEEVSGDTSSVITSTVIEPCTSSAVSVTISSIASTSGASQITSDNQGMLSSVSLAAVPTTTEEVVIMSITETVVPLPAAVSTTEPCPEETITVSISSTTVITVGLNPNYVAPTSRNEAPFCTGGRVTVTITEGSSEDMTTTGSSVTSNANGIIVSPFLGWPKSEFGIIIESNTLPSSEVITLVISSSTIVKTLHAVLAPTTTPASDIPSSILASNYSTSIARNATSNHSAGSSFHNSAQTIILPASPTSLSSSHTVDPGKTITVSLAVALALWGGQMLLY